MVRLASCETVTTLLYVVGFRPSCPLPQHPRYSQRLSIFFCSLSARTANKLRKAENAGALYTSTYTNIERLVLPEDQEHWMEYLEIHLFLSWFHLSFFGRKRIGIIIIIIVSHAEAGSAVDGLMCASGFGRSMGSSSLLG